MLPTTSHEIRRPGELGKIYLLSLGISTPCYKLARSAQRGFFKSNEQGCTPAATVNTRHPAHGQDAATAWSEPCIPSPRRSAAHQAAAADLHSPQKAVEFVIAVCQCHVSNLFRGFNCCGTCGFFSFASLGRKSYWSELLRYTCYAYLSNI